MPKIVKCKKENNRVYIHFSSQFLFLYHITFIFFNTKQYYFIFKYLYVNFLKQNKFCDIYLAVDLLSITSHLKFTIAKYSSGIQVVLMLYFIIN